MERVFRYVVRILETDVSGELPLLYGLAEVKGVGYNLAYAICKVLNLDPYMKTGFLTDSEVESIEKAVKDPASLGIPTWMYNRRKDYATGVDIHLYGAQLIYYAKEDIEREKRIKSWRGIRHALGLKVRGQRTRTTGRTGITVGVKRKKAVQQQKK
ncbi:MAG: 30S ribosomal protein S13 [Desulfurococcaceae archaeon]|nr:30S ribosomal protein S13 [Desulfurococcaceae archaeon]